MSSRLQGCVYGSKLYSIMGRKVITVYSDSAQNQWQLSGVTDRGPKEAKHLKTCDTFFNMQNT